MAAANRSVARLAAQTLGRTTAISPSASAASSLRIISRLSQQQSQRQISTTTITTLRQTPRHAAAPVPSTRAYYSQDAAAPGPGPGGESKIWSFEDVKSLAAKGDKADVIIVDAREPGELQDTGRIPGAINIPITTQPDSFHISEEEFEDRFGYPRPAKDAEVVFYCKAGVRSRAAAQLARSAGWTKTGEYPGSWLDWVANGGKVQR